MTYKPLSSEQIAALLAQLVQQLNPEVPTIRECKGRTYCNIYNKKGICAGLSISPKDNTISFGFSTEDASYKNKIDFVASTALNQYKMAYSTGTRNANLLRWDNSAQLVYQGSEDSLKQICRDVYNACLQIMGEESTSQSKPSAVSSEEESLKARIAELEKELKKKQEATTKVTTTKEERTIKKSNDPFDGLMVKVCAGMFRQTYFYQRGSAYDEYPGGDKRKKPIHHAAGWSVVLTESRVVTISKEFAICKYPVTQGMWKKIMGEGFNMSNNRGDDNLPVENVTFEEVQDFITKLNKLTGKQYRLPTEAEWEWAAKGASKDNDNGSWAGCNEEEQLEQYAWYAKNSEGKTHPVGTKKPNELGLYDMTGNVWEICKDDVVWTGSAKPCLGSTEVKDPCFISDYYYSDSRHIIKGGCFDTKARPSGKDTIGCFIRCFGSQPKNTRSFRVGFRLAETIE